MKNYILLLMLNIVGFGWSVSAEPKLARLSDGYNARCLEGADIGSRSNRVRLLNFEAGQEHVLLNLKIEFFECQKNNSKFELIKQSLSQATNNGIQFESPVLIFVSNEKTVLAEIPLDVRLETQTVSRILNKNDFSKLDIFVRVLAGSENFGRSYESFGPFRLLY